MNLLNGTIQFVEKLFRENILNLLSHVFKNCYFPSEKDKDMELKIWTDGACSGNPGPGGWASVIVDNKDVVLGKISGYEPNTTNNRMELRAAIEGIKEGFTKYHASKITIYTDSSYLKNGITDWINKWKSNNWKTANKSSVKNQDLWIVLDQLSTKYNISWEWIKGHSDNSLNNLADGLAVVAIKKSN